MSWVSGHPKKLDVGSDNQIFWQLHIIIGLQLCLTEIWGLLKYYAVILVYTLCNSFHYICESSSISGPTLYIGLRRQA